eukprot:364114-Chlamydomonas_euryale.AAC.11
MPHTSSMGSTDGFPIDTSCVSAVRGGGERGTGKGITQRAFGGGYFFLRDGMSDATGSSTWRVQAVAGWFQIRACACG